MPASKKERKKIGSVSLFIAVLCESGSGWLHTDCGKERIGTSVVGGGGEAYILVSTKMEQSLK
jgi:hypothetical protein